MAMVDMFLKIDTVKGESKDSKHAGEIDILEFSFGVAQQGVAHTGGGSGAPSGSAGCGVSGASGWVTGSLGSGV